MVDQREVRPEESIDTVLVIADDQRVRDSISQHLAGRGIRVEAAASSQEGLPLVKESRPAAIVLDVLMPEMDGWSMLSSLKANPDLAEIPVIMITVAGGRERGLILAVSDYLTKPLDYKRLAAVLRKYRSVAGGEAEPPAGQALIVEDSLIMRQMLQRVLVQEGWQVAEADDGPAALEYVTNQQPDLILLDLMLPGMDGFKFMSELRSTPAWLLIPVVVVTALDLTSVDYQRLTDYLDQVLHQGTTLRSYEELLADIHDLLQATLRLAPQGLFSPG